MSDRYSNQGKGNQEDLSDLLKRVRYFPDALDYVNELIQKEVEEEGLTPELAIQKISVAANLTLAANVNRLGATVHFTSEKVMEFMQEDSSQLKS